MLLTTNKSVSKVIAQRESWSLVQSVGVKFPGIVPDPD
ncbi:hypothetical protein PDR5_28040 [Pseudomonas sp. DR 5-09]|nr:hypothetical protein PDR5_28040 [Pseudomonas sp. DR 5-09]